ncbi:hypothetical protein [Adlercreutzia sp. ZJ473]|uniref:hypothetical protein n=1 Tax=Adlercreutzia sp. ZJ473 TaxID=2722822 RepID=UPI001556D03D|nr:hypothetical protein [Adlercreutzia sp. ZJ473]
MITYPVLTRSTVVKRFEFDDVRYTVAVLLAMARGIGATLRELVDLLCLENDDIADLIDDAPCNHALPFEAAVSEMLLRFGACADAAPIPPYGSFEGEAEMPALLVELVSFNSDLDEPAALYGLMCDGTLDWLGSDDFRRLPVPLNQVASERIALVSDMTAA